MAIGKISEELRNAVELPIRVAMVEPLGAKRAFELDRLVGRYLAVDVGQEPSFGLESNTKKPCQAKLDLVSTAGE